MERILQLMAVLENAHREHKAGVANSYTLQKEAQALTLLKKLLTEKQSMEVV